MIQHFITLLLLIAAVGTGLYTMHRHQDYFSEFTVIDLAQGRLDGWLFVVNSLTTAGCMVDLVLHTTWLIEQPPVGVTVRWSFMWAILHMGEAILSIIIHLVIFNLLKRDNFCRLCRQPWKH